MKLWSDERIVVTVDGPLGRRKLTVPRPFARVGTHPDSEVVLGEGAPQRTYYLHVAGGCLYGLRLDLEGREDLEHCGGWIKPSDAIILGPYRLTARLKSPVAALTALPSLIAPGSAEIPLPVLNVFCGSDLKEKHRLHSRLALVGRHGHCTLRLRGRKVSLLHCAAVLGSAAALVHRPFQQQRDAAQRQADRLRRSAVARSPRRGRIRAGLSSLVAAP